MADTSEMEIISSQHGLFSGSFSIDFLNPEPASPNRRCSTIMRATYHAHPLQKQGKQHPQAAPYMHMHFAQAETFVVLKGGIGTTFGWTATDKVYTPADGEHVVRPGIPHRFWPSPDFADEDTVVLFWVHPKDTPGDMEHQFFEQVFLLIDDAYGRKTLPDPVQLFVMLHETNSALVVFPTAWWLGPLRWWVPWVVQAGMAMAGRAMGYKPLPYSDEHGKKKTT